MHGAFSDIGARQYFGQADFFMLELYYAKYAYKGHVTDSELKSS